MMVRRLLFAIFAIFLGLARADEVEAGSTIIALGDSISFGETDLNYVQSYGDRGYVSLLANSLAAQSGGVRPNVINLAIDGETTSSFNTGMGRVPPVTGRTDSILASENLNYNPNALMTQNAMFQAAVATQQTLGNTVSTVSISLGDNNLFTLANLPGFVPGSANDPLLAPTLATYQSQYAAILAEVRNLLPNAKILLIGSYNPFPAEPGNAFAALAAAGGAQVNSIIQSLASQFNAQYVDTFDPFVGHEAAYTYQAQLPSGSSVGGTYGGTLPLGDVHPNALGYSVIAAAASVPEPSSWVLMGLGLATSASLAGRRIRSAQSH